MFLRFFAVFSALLAWIGAASAVPVSVGSPVSGTYDISSFASPIINGYEFVLDPSPVSNQINTGEGIALELYDDANNLVKTRSWTNSGADAFSLSLGTVNSPIPQTGMVVVYALSGFFEITSFELDFISGASGNNRHAIALTPVPAVPLPAALPLLAGGFGVLALLGWRRRLAG